MPVNYQQTRFQIKNLGKNARRLHDQFKDQYEDALQTLDEQAENLDTIRGHIESALEKNDKIRCALPTDEPLNRPILLPETQVPHVILAADGSQINPDRHAAVEFGLINIGMIRIQPGSGEVPQLTTDTRLLGEDAFHRPGSPPGEELIALERDLNERKKLAEMAALEKCSVITMTDGPLELYREPHQKSQEYARKFDEYLETFLDLDTSRVIPAGYVDKPRADLVVRMLELQRIPLSETGKYNHKRFFTQIADVHLFAGHLPPESRSPLFEIRSPSAARFKDKLALHFFYLNTGTENEPSLARVEIPRWVAASREMVDLLHAALVHECRQLGSRPYPYALHRAHEVALVTFTEKEQIMQMIIAELTALGIPVGKTSSKQFHKNISGNRTRL